MNNFDIKSAYVIILQRYVEKSNSLKELNGGFGFATYGDPGERYARIYDFTESDVVNYTQQTIYYTEFAEPEAPEEPVPEPEPEDSTENCSCNCHRTGFMGFIWKILRFFYKLFGTNKICSCGAAHY